MIKLEASKRLQAQELHKQLIGDTAGTRRCKDFTKDYVKQKQKFKSLGAKDGFEMFVFKDPPFQTIVMVTNNEVIAYLELAKVHDSAKFRWYAKLPSKYFIVSELFIHPDFRGQKLGTVLHLGAAHAVKWLASDIDIAKAAFMAFKSLDKYGYKLGLYNGSTGTPVDFKWGADSIPVIDGKSMEDLDNNFVLYTK